MALKGKVQLGAPFFHRLERALTKVVDSHGSIKYGGTFIGSGGAYIVATMATPFSSRFHPFPGLLLQRWKRKVVPPSENDFILGHAGTLICLAELQDLVPNWSPPVVFLRKCHQSLVKALLAIRKGKDPFYLGFAHGIAGSLLGLEIARTRLSLSTSSSLVNWAFDQLQSNQYLVSGASLWPEKTLDEEINSNSWCHGSPGIALALLGCYRVTGKTSYLELFKRAAWGSERYHSIHRSICCGFAGKANLFIEAYRYFRKKSWLERARKMLPDNRRKTISPLNFRSHDRNTFFRGAMGVAYTYDRITDPDLALPGTGFAGTLK
jgi:serine/threonine-protein kinase